MFGAISIKSRLNSTELKDAYKNICELKSILPRESFTHSSIPGHLAQLAPPVVATGIFAYAVDRSLEAVREQIEKLDLELPEAWMRPDFVAILGVGIIGPSNRLRGSFNKFSLPKVPGDVAHLSKTGRHTLLRLYMRILDECNMIVLRPLHLSAYEDMPRLVGTYRVRHHDGFLRQEIGNAENRKVISLNVGGIGEIVAMSKPVTRRQNFLNWIGMIPVGAEDLYDLDETIKEYNPENLPAFDSGKVEFDAEGHAYHKGASFQPVQIEVDGMIYAVNLVSLPPGSFDDSTDYTVDELFARLGRNAPRRRSVWSPTTPAPSCTERRRIGRLSWCRCRGSNLLAMVRDRRPSQQRPYADLSEVWPKPQGRGRSTAGCSRSS